MLCEVSEKGVKSLTWVGNVLAGSVAGGLSRLCIAPLDVVKIRFQTQYQPLASQVTAKYRTLRGAVVQIAREEGLKALWAGNMMAECLWITYAAVQFGCFYEMKKRKADSMLSDGMCGAVAGMVATIVSYPLDLIRTRFASQGVPKIYKNWMDVVRDVHSSRGLAGLYTGLFPTLLLIAPSVAVQFATYEMLNDMSKKYGHNKGEGKHSTVVSGVLGCASGAAAKISVYPLDTVKKRLQVLGMNRSLSYGPIAHYRGTRHALYRIVQEEGVCALYRGLSPAIMKTAPATGITFACFEWCKRLMLEH
jgi:solute carrier family 25 thiamine pyrophosphate transporter 19